MAQEWAPKLSKDKELEWNTKAAQRGGVAKSKMKKKGGKKKGGY